MSTKIPVFPITQQPQQFTDYGFEPQLDYFQVLEEARKHKDLHYRLQKPISKDDSSKKIKKSKKRWWRSALTLFKLPRWAPPAADKGGRRRRIGSVSAPVYITESGSVSPCWRRGPLAAEGVGIPYVSLREMDVDLSHRASAASATPIYLVT